MNPIAAQKGSEGTASFGATGLVAANGDDLADDATAASDGCGVGAAAAWIRAANFGDGDTAVPSPAIWGAGKGNGAGCGMRGAVPGVGCAGVGFDD